MKKKFVMIIGVLVMILSASQALIAEASTQEPRGIIVTGDAVIEKEPDQTTIQFTILTTGKTSTEVQAENAKISSRVYQAFLSEGIERNTWKTVQMSLSPQYDYSGAKSKMVGYQMVHRIMVVLPGTEKAGKVVSMLVENDVNNIDSIQFGLKDPKGAQREALALATQNAKTKAEVLAASSGTRITGIAYMGEPTVSYRAYDGYYDKRAVADMAGAALEQQVWASTINISARVEIRFEIVE